MPTPTVTAALGTSATAANPSSRASTPTAAAKGSAVRSAIVPFTRPFDCDVSGTSAPASSAPRSFTAAGGGSLRRPEWRPPLGSGGSSLAAGSASMAARAAAGAPSLRPTPAEVVVAGFAPARTDAAPVDGPVSPARPGLLSRVLTSMPLSVEEVRGG